jgi:hypothetical protein
VGGASFGEGGESNYSIARELNTPTTHNFFLQCKLALQFLNKKSNFHSLERKGFDYGTKLHCEINKKKKKPHAKITVACALTIVVIL